jgi:tRNA threonylcarbamoyl adenosine modification protein YeaZ
MPFFIALQSTYTHLEIGLFKANQTIARVAIDKTLATKDSIAQLDSLLRQNHLHLRDITFIAANQGPAPFTTLRVAISMVNGLAFASGIPLVGIDGLHGFLAEYAHTNAAIVVLLNAFGNDVYYAMQSAGLTMTGIASTSSIIVDIAQKIPDQPILFLGNGITPCLATIKATFGNRALFLDPNPATMSLNHLAQLALAQWHNKQNITTQIQPSYYKSAVY